MLTGQGGPDGDLDTEMKLVPSAKHEVALKRRVTRAGVSKSKRLASVCAREVVMATSFLSVPFFAVPAAMLTWGFEAEAQRLAQRRSRHSTREKLRVQDCDSSSSEDDAFDESPQSSSERPAVPRDVPLIAKAPSIFRPACGRYLEQFGDGDDDELGEEALDFFKGFRGEDVLPAVPRRIVRCLLAIV